MSRIGKKVIDLPKGVEVSVETGEIRVKGPKGELVQAIDASLTVTVEGDKLWVKRSSDARTARSQHGLARSLISNMVTGVSTGFTRTLDIIGVGYRVTQQGRGIQIAVGYSHPVNIDPLPGVELEVDVDTRAKTSRIHIRGIDKQRVGQVAADLRAIRSPEPYKGKGIRYLGEVVQRKMGKAGRTG